MKAQFSIEYFGSMLLFLVAVLAIASIGAGQVPEFRSNVQQASLNLEAYSLSTRMITQPGYHDNGGGTDWEENINNLRSIEDVGLASDYKVLELDKVQNLSTVGSQGLNYSLFTESLELSNNYRFRFTWMPVITTSESYTRSRPPSDIKEPDSGISEYWNAGNEVHYSITDFGPENYCFLVLSHDGLYDTVYKTEWQASNPHCDFGTFTSHKEGNDMTLSGHEFEVQNFQNREREPGSFFMLNKELNTFGGSMDRDSRVVKLNRYAALNFEGTRHPLKMEVWAW